MPDIEFNPKLPMSSDVPSLIWLGKIQLKTYENVFPGETTEIINHNSYKAWTQQVRVSPPPFSGAAFRDVIQAELDYDRIVATWGTTVNTEKVLLEICVGENATYRYYIRWCGVLAELYGGPNRVRIASKVYWSTETIASHARTNELLATNGLNFIHQSPSAVQMGSLSYGLGLARLPGRPDNIENYLLTLFIGGTRDGNPNYVDLRYSDVSGQNPYRSYSFGATDQYTHVAPGYMRIVAAFDLSQIENNYNAIIPEAIYSEQAGPESAQGGMNKPAFDDSSDTIALPDNPSLNMTTLGFFNVYATTSLSALNDLGNYIFGSAITSQSTTEDILKAIGNNMFHSKLIDYIVSCHVIPVAPNVGSTPTITAINLGHQTLEDVSLPKVTEDYVSVDCGSIALDEYYENFADFLEDAKLFLPFIGFVPARPEWFKNTSLSVNYKFNVIDGSCIAFVRSTGRYANNGNADGTIVGQYSGTASIRFPITGVSYSNMATGVIGSVASLATASAAGSVLGVAGSAINMAQMKPGIAQSNGYNACASMMGVRRPYLYIERPVSSYARNYQHELGIPANIWGTLGDVDGFVKMENVHVDGIAGATDFEKNEIARLLAQGVIV